MKTVRRKTIRIACYCVAAISVLTAYAYKEHAKAEYYRHEALTFARQASSELALSAQELNLTLTKCALSPSDELTRAMCTKLYGTCLVTAAAIDSLPWQHELEHVTSMLEEAELMALHGAQTGQIDSKKISKIQNDFEKTAQLLNEAYSSFNGAAVTFENSVIDPYSDSPNGLNENLIMEINKSASDYSAEQNITKNSGITPDEARAKSARIINCDTEEVICNEITGSLGTVYYCSREPYIIGINNEGKFVYYSNDSQLGGNGASIQDALSAARDFSQKAIGVNVDLISYRIEDGFLRCTITGCNNNIYDIDTPINVTVDMSDAKIASYDAVEYHHAAKLRTELYKSYSSQQSELKIDIPKEADKESETLCIIKMPWNEQFICLGYTVTNEEGIKYKIYYDAINGIPVDLRIITEQEHELTIS